MPAELLPPRSPVTLPGAIQFDLPSQIGGRTYRIFVFEPATAPPPSGYPLVVATDGNMTFPIMATLDATFALAGPAALVVGVGYTSDDPAHIFSVRNADLTPATAPGADGGSQDFYRFLVEELLPAIAGAYPVDDRDHTLYGHSIAGMFTLDVLLKHPESFRNFVASSPSIWWNKRSVLDEVPRFAHKIRSGAAAPRVLILVGAKEQDVPATLPPAMTRGLEERLRLVPSRLRNAVAKIVLKKKMLEYRMVDNARDLSAYLQQIEGAPGYLVRFNPLEDEDHLTVVSASISRALAFALRP